MSEPSARRPQPENGYYPKTIAVDLDGVLARYDRWRGPLHFGAPIEGAREFLAALRRLGRVLIYTTRTSAEANGGTSVVELVDRVRGWLDDHELPYDAIHAGGGKPIAAAYVDDRAVVCRPQEYGRAAFEAALDRVAFLTETER
ncbi:hypothetical protein JCM19992_16110 [Thermostilla marina]